MRYLIFTDIHGNLEALEAVFESLKDQDIDHYLFLGDLVGYGASPNSIIEKIQDLKPCTKVRGNHDKAVCQAEPVDNFNPIAAAAIQWTKRNITEANLKLLKKIPEGPLKIDNSITICHGSPFDEDYYIFGEFDAAEAFLHLETPLCFFGHTHFPFVYRQKAKKIEGTFMGGNTQEIIIEKGTNYLINPGSVGQPRDRDSRAAYAVYDSKEGMVRIFRIKYDIKGAQQKILNKNLPKALADRLALGI
jgi:predicted phosphodiesterase